MHVTSCSLCGAGDGEPSPSERLVDLVRAVCIYRPRVHLQASDLAALSLVSRECRRLLQSEAAADAWAQLSPFPRRCSPSIVAGVLRRAGAALSAGVCVPSAHLSALCRCRRRPPSLREEAGFLQILQALPPGLLRLSFGPEDDVSRGRFTVDALRLVLARCPLIRDVGGTTATDPLPPPGALRIHLRRAPDTPEGVATLAAALPAGRALTVRGGVTPRAAAQLLLLYPTLERIESTVFVASPEDLACALRALPPQLRGVRLRASLTAGKLGGREALTPSVDCIESLDVSLSDWRGREQRAAAGADANAIAVLRSLLSGASLRAAELHLHGDVAQSRPVILAALDAAAAAAARRRLEVLRLGVDEWYPDYTDAVRAVACQARHRREQRSEATTSTCTTQSRGAVVPLLRVVPPASFLLR